ncbi:class I SAM-dependent methyltransferase [Pelagicoccus enzymogenes]|uniref:class I SAM-dependent methyltransferase n=1 Tax=Pelagicoccus enzymogenes TaxID=2773457 RepID=UPI0028106315|nr:class I SAM-dependent methyltransferase [Pelagicoccus enzymogenes]MDQ8199179.1 class I SAM-dependent methyltransferase [Pelagicoccus enzymogenes]
MDSANPSVTKEPQYQELLERQKQKGLARFGLMSSQVYFDDPKRVAFVLARYKFASKLLEGKQNVLEVGCADAFGTPLVAKAVDNLTALDFDPVFIEDATDRTDPELGIEFLVHDILKAPLAHRKFDAAYAIDVFEHIEPSVEDTFLDNIIQSLNTHGVLILGIPSLESQEYASPQSKAGHVNCKSGADFKRTLQRKFENVFLFSMNDEVVHTGFSKMAHYLFVVCATPKVTSK